MMSSILTPNTPANSPNTPANSPTRSECPEDEHLTLIRWVTSLADNSTLQADAQKAGLIHVKVAWEDTWQLGQLRGQ
jgi:hypothetical protein